MSRMPATKQIGVNVIIRKSPVIMAAVDEKKVRFDCHVYIDKKDSHRRKCHNEIFDSCSNVILLSPCNHKQISNKDQQCTLCLRKEKEDTENKNTKYH